MLNAENGKVDAVYCGTPDHAHTVITSMDAENMKFVNDDMADEYITPNYRSGWTF